MVFLLVVHLYCLMVTSNNDILQLCFVIFWLTSIMCCWQHEVSCYLHGILFLCLDVRCHSLKTKWHCLPLFGLLSQSFGLLPILLVHLKLYYWLSLNNSKTFLWLFVEFLFPMVQQYFLIYMVLLRILLYHHTFVHQLKMVNVVGVFEVNVVYLWVLSSHIPALIYCMFFLYNPIIMLLHNIVMPPSLLIFCSFLLMLLIDDLHLIFSHTLLSSHQHIGQKIFSCVRAATNLVCILQVHIHQALICLWFVSLPGCLLVVIHKCSFVFLCRSIINAIFCLYCTFQWSWGKVFILNIIFSNRSIFVLK